MRKILQNFTVLCFCATIFFPEQIKAQPPQKISYQAIIRNSDNQLVVNQQVGMKISIQKYIIGTPQMPPSYQNIYIETHNTTTNDNGLVSIQIGGGDIVGGTFSDINWGSGTYYIKTETDPTGGTNYTITGQSQILSVPYALNAKSVESLQTDASLVGEGNTTQPLKLAQQSATNGQVLIWDGAGWKPGMVTMIGTSNRSVQQLNSYEFKTGTSVPFLITYQELGLASALDLNRFLVINLEVGWNPNAGASDPSEYRSLRDGIYYSISLPPNAFTGIKVFFPNNLEYQFQEGRILYMLVE